jgi:hypothetical protein
METEPFSIYIGASWMDLDGMVYIVPGFHDEWIQSHPELVGSSKTVSDLISKKRWVSIVVYSGGYIEICINDINDTEVILLIHRFLSKNKGKWNTALIMPMVIEGFIQICSSEFDTIESFNDILKKSFGIKSQ